MYGMSRVEDGKHLVKLRLEGKGYISIPPVAYGSSFVWGSYAQLSCIYA